MLQKCVLDASLFSSVYPLLFHRIVESFTHVKNQCLCLWQPSFVEVLFSDILAATEKSEVRSNKGNKKVYQCGMHSG